MRWWEAVNVPPRVLHFIEFGEGFTVVVLICEVLAQNDEVADLIRAIGPTGIVTPLLDGRSSHRGGPLATRACLPTTQVPLC